MLKYRCFFLWCIGLLLPLAGGEIYFSGDGVARTRLSETDGEYRQTVAFPGSFQIFYEPERATFRPQMADFNFGMLSAEIKSDQPLNAFLFVKDKDGKWFQTSQEFVITPGEWQTLSARLDDIRAWRSAGGSVPFSAYYAANIFDYGVSVYRREAGEANIAVRKFERSGVRKAQPLAVTDWRSAVVGEVNRRISSTFGLTREFFNPFDPDEIKVDFELKLPDGQVKTYPAFFTQNFVRSQHFNRETVTPDGAMTWEFRFTPECEGVYEVRIIAMDVLKNETVTAPWRPVNVEKSKHPGKVAVSSTRPNYFELSGGEFFFPVALNIHTNTDRRSEISFKFGYLPDRGTYDYDEYLAACGKNGINAVEVWMSGWTMALEQSASRPGFYGVGRYNLQSAWKLDQVIDTAARNNIYINLVIDNHGRLSNTSDPEWADNPINAKSEYAVANGGFLAEPGQFFGSDEAAKNNSKRARYIAARWGATPNIMAVELWSEVDLVENFDGQYNDGAVTKWTKNAAGELRQASQLDWPVSIHICSDFRKLSRFPQLFELDEITHLAGDAYRDKNIYFTDHLRDYEKNMRWQKPQLITEYGGSPQGSSRETIIGDIHSGLWGSLFSRLASTPFLWWHDFVHFGPYYQHYYGFSEYLKGVDLRDFRLTFFTPELFIKPWGKAKIDKPTLGDAIGYPGRKFRDYRFEAMAVAKSDAVYGWVYNREMMYRYQDNYADYPNVYDLFLSFPNDLAPGWYWLRYYDTMTGKCVGKTEILIAGQKKIVLPVLPFQADTAFKLEKIK